MDSWAYLRCRFGYFSLSGHHYIHDRVYSCSFVPSISSILTIFFDSFGKYYSPDRTDSYGTRTDIV